MTRTPSRAIGEHQFRAFEQREGVLLLVVSASLDENQFPEQREHLCFTVLEIGQNGLDHSSLAKAKPASS
jgi:hypothetical protein